jgi:diguanylate cyclase (GGDEF)-like protein
MRMGVRTRFIIAVAVGGLILAAVLYAGWRVQRQGLQALAQVSRESMRAQALDGLEQRGRAMAQLLAETLINPTYFVDLKSIGEIAQAAVRQPGVAYIVVFDAKGRILHDGSDDIARFGQMMDDALGGRASRAEKLLVLNSETVVDVTQPMYLGDEKLGGVRIGLSREGSMIAMTEADARLRAAGKSVVDAQLRALALPLSALGLLAVLAVLAVSRGMVRPIRELAGHARALERGKFDIVVDSDRDDEVGDLIRAFGTMSKSLAAHDRDVRRLAYLDTLTGLPNRLMLRESLVRSLTVGASRGIGLALLFVDLDDFKRINDTLGHDAGDEALAQLSKRFEGCLDRVRQHESGKDSLEFIARFGGDEFVALLAGTEVRDRARALAEHMLDAVRAPLSVAGRPVHLNASIGITLFPEDAQDAAQLLKNGDIAMYQAKVHGKNCYRFFTNYMTKLAEDRLALEQDLRLAMRHGDLELHYQPIVDLATERIAGAEALLRWRHPERGLVPSELFVGIAEDFGLIDELGRFALHQACVEAARWPAVDGVAPFVSVNLSVKQLRQPGLPAEIGAVLLECSLAPTRLHVELTESALLDDEPLALSTLAELRRVGVKIWLDDFGTGFSGLSHLRRVAVDGVKIDRSFTQDLLTDRDDLALTSAIIAMADSLGITAVAEGVESASQLEILRGMRCDMGQGFWLGYPMSGAEFRARLDEGRHSAHVPAAS